MGAQVLSVSVDSVFVHKMWNEHELSKMIGKDVPFPMLSDQDGSIGRMYGIYDEDGGVETRGRFLIDPDGVVAKVFPKVQPKQHDDLVLKALAELA